MAVFSYLKTDSQYRIYGNYQKGDKWYEARSLSLASLNISTQLYVELTVGKQKRTL